MYNLLINILIIIKYLILLFFSIQNGSAQYGRFFAWDANNPEKGQALLARKTSSFLNPNAHCVVAWKPESSKVQVKLVPASMLTFE
jgi:hypothetical protein